MNTVVKFAVITRAYCSSKHEATDLETTLDLEVRYNRTADGLVDRMLQSKDDPADLESTTFGKGKKNQKGLGERLAPTCCSCRGCDGCHPAHRDSWPFRTYPDCCAYCDALAFGRVPPGSCKDVCGKGNVGRQECLDMGATTSHLNVLSGPQGLSNILRGIANQTKRLTYVKALVALAPLLSGWIMHSGASAARAKAKSALAGFAGLGGATLLARSLADATAIVPCCSWTSDPSDEHRNVCMANSRKVLKTSARTRLQNLTVSLQSQFIANPLPIDSSTIAKFMTDPVELKICHKGEDQCCDACIRENFPRMKNRDACRCRHKKQGRPPWCSCYCDNQLAAQTSPNVKRIPVVALLGVFVGSGVAFTLLRVHHDKTNTADEALLAT